MGKDLVENKLNNNFICLLEQRGAVENFHETKTFGNKAMFSGADEEDNDDDEHMTSWHQGVYSQVVGLLQLCPCLKYCGFSMTGILVIPITTASCPASRVQGLIIPWFT